VFPSNKLISVSLKYPNQVLAFLPADEIPVIVLNRDDIDEDDESAKDSATGMVQRNGKWEIQE